MNKVSWETGKYNQYYARFLSYNRLS